MADLGVGNSDRGIWRRWLAGNTRAAAAPDALTVAAYAEGRLSEAQAEPIEAWLAVHPDALAELVAARTLPQRPEHAVERMIARASALVDGDPAFAENVMPFRRPVAPWRNALAWSSVAASLAAASFVGFVMGSDVYRNLSPTLSSDSGYAETFEAAPSLESFFSDESGT